MFFALEQFLHWHHCHRAQTSCKQPLTYLILLGDGLHNFIGGMAIAGTFLVGGLVAYYLSFNIDISFLIPFAAGNFPVTACFISSLCSLHRIAAFHSFLFFSCLSW